MPIADGIGSRLIHVDLGFVHFVTAMLPAGSGWQTHGVDDRFPVMLPPEPNLVRRKSSWASAAFERLPIIPGHPLRGLGRDCRGVALQLREVVERVGVAQFAGMDQAHE